ncbi:MULTISPECIES: DUF397 domain-containing protein [unclassified Streptomyces]|uniref:DUF397 domain-containing protein n=1 Tax=unclassified Streptomyces TaxID=2593676 RepID=UPI00093B0BDF|nr:DUF397 domain-containing protein [Streptomyces sp. TSRI0281]OKI35070.1 DUF397 domain-containing protein [Streptomyces sp. TSRI0281]
MVQKPNWRTSSYTKTGNCVEVADNAKVVLIRDTKNRKAGTLSMPTGPWKAFVEFSKNAL